MTSRPIGLLRDLPSKRVMRTEVDGNDLVVWRAADGNISAWDNRCPHRGMALSHGFVRGNSLACLYHGWHYGTSGVCNYIPAHPDLDPPETIHTARHSVKERDGVIWVSVDNDAAGQPLGLDPLRSFIACAPEKRVRAACAETSLNGTVPEIADDGGYTIAEDRVAVLCSPRRDGTCVTVLVAPGLLVARRRALSRWCEAMRRAAETESAS